MRKEVILAVIIGVLLGGVILYGINLANNSSLINPSANTATKEGNLKVSPTPSSKPAGQISIIFPQNNAVVTEAQITLKGTAKSNSSIAIVTENDDLLTTADSAGNFSATINLISGENVITVTAVDDKQALTTSSITVIRTATLPE
jgi:hypothetical protein